MYAAILALLLAIAAACCLDWADRYNGAATPAGSV
jgi:hypothetical protein